jgi:23S rRNA (adenine2030-N6)-methyltransferase
MVMDSTCYWYATRSLSSLKLPRKHHSELGGSLDHMNYRHAYHAGNFADVLKHVVLVHALLHLTRKATPFRVLDTHAGSGRYALDSAQASKTGEWETGIGRVLSSAPRAHGDVQTALAPYLALVRRELGADGQLRGYPGSPVLAAAHLRDDDKLVTNELNVDDYKRLAATFKTDRRVKVTALDGYTALKASLPPPERRGLVLIDPPFEQPGEFQRMAEGLTDGLERFKTGIYLLWYPIKDMKPVDRFRRNVADIATRFKIDSLMDIELLLRPARHPDLLNGCGLIVVNAPFKLAETMEPVAIWLAETIGERGAAGAIRTINT